MPLIYRSAYVKKEPALAYDRQRNHNVCRLHQSKSLAFACVSKRRGFRSSNAFTCGLEHGRTNSVSAAPGRRAHRIAAASSAPKVRSKDNDVAHPTTSDNGATHSSTTSPPSLNTADGPVGTVTPISAALVHAAPSTSKSNSTDGAAGSSAPASDADMQSTQQLLSRLAQSGSALPHQLLVAESPGSDLLRALGVTSVVMLLALATELNKPWIAQHQDPCMAAIFLLGYVGIVVEESLTLNKAGVALLMAASLWSVRAAGTGTVEAEVSETLADVSQVIFFLLGAMTVVEVVEMHQGFKIITNAIQTRSKNQLLWTVGLFTFCLSAVLDNLTTTIVMVSLLQKLCPDQATRRYLGAVVVVAANAGGAWTPIGDVTTTMLWAGEKITALTTMKELLLPSLVSMAVPVVLMGAVVPELQGQLSDDMEGRSNMDPEEAPRGNLVLSAGVGALLFVPMFRTITGLPPYLGMIAGLGFLWLLTDALHIGEGRKYLTVSRALKRVDVEGVLFFLGILMAVGALNAAGVLKEVAFFLDTHVQNEDAVAGLIGLASAIVDNVPLVAAAMGMYDLNEHPLDSPLWQLLAYCAGTGGSLLIIGSASGVAYMGVQEGASFEWWLRRVSPWVLIGYVAGLATYVTVHSATMVLS